MDIEQQFNDLGVDAIIGTELMRLLGVNKDDFIDPMRFMRFQDVAQFFKNHPDRQFTINKLTAGKMVDKLDHVWGYTELQRQKLDSEVELMKAKQNLYGIDQDNPLFQDKFIQAENDVQHANEKINNIIDQMSYYER